MNEMTNPNHTNRQPFSKRFTLFGQPDLAGSPAVGVFFDIIERSDAEALVPESVATDILQSLPEGSAIMRQGLQLPNIPTNQHRMPVLSALPMAYFVGETVSGETLGDSHKQTTKMEWANKFINVGEIAAIVPIPESVLNDASYDIWGQTRPHLIAALGAKFDGAVLYGTDKPSDWPTALVTAAAAAGNSLALGATVGDLYDDIMGEAGLIALLEEDGYFADGYLGSLSMRGKLRGLRDDNGQPIFKRTNAEGMQGATRYELDGAPIDFPRNGAFNAASSLLIAGEWNKLVWAIRQDITWKILDQAVIQDPSTGDIVYNLAQQDMVALRVVVRLGWQVPNPVNAIRPTEGQRYPFAVLTPAASS